MAAGVSAARRRSQPGKSTRFMVTPWTILAPLPNRRAGARGGTSIAGSELGSFGLSVVEALASGTPVAAIPNGALPELIGAGFGAVAADVSAGALADAILVAAACSRADAVRASRRFSFDAMVDGYEDVLKHVAATRTSELIQP